MAVVNRMLRYGMLVLVVVLVAVPVQAPAAVLPAQVAVVAETHRQATSSYVRVIRAAVLMPLARAMVVMCSSTLAGVAATSRGLSCLTVVVIILSRAFRADFVWTLLASPQPTERTYNSILALVETISSGAWPSPMMAPVMLKSSTGTAASVLT